MPFGSLLTRARQARGVKQTELAERLGLARSTLSSWEADRRKPDIEQLAKLCTLLHVSADVLLERVPFQLGPMPESESP